MRAILERVQRRAVGDAHAGGAVEVQAGGQLYQFIGGKRDALARGAIAGITEHAVAGCKGGDPRAHALDGAGKFGGRRERHLGLVLVFPGDDQGIEKVQCCRGNPHHGFTGPGPGVGNVGKFEIVGSAVTGAEQCFHGTARGVE